MSTPAASGGGAASRLALKQTPLDTWSTREHLALASAVLRSGDQNWMSVSRAMRGFADPGRPPDWFSQKNCAQQYARLLELVDTPRRKRERGEPNDTPGQSIVRKLRQDRTDELRRQVTETRASYTTLKAQIRQLRSGQLDARLDEIQREIQAEKEAAAQQQERQRQWIADREAQKLAVQQALRAQVTKAPPPPPPKRRKPPLDPRESSPSEAGSVLSEPDFADSPASEVPPAEVSGDEASRDAAELRPAPASPLLTSLLRSPSSGRPAAAAAVSEPGAPSVTPTGSATLSRLLELPAGTPGHSLPRTNLFPAERKPEQNGESSGTGTAAAGRKPASEVKQERPETAAETPAPPPPPPPPPQPKSAPVAPAPPPPEALAPPLPATPAPPPPVVRQPEPPAQPAAAAETEVRSEPPAEQADAAKKTPAESTEGASIKPATDPAVTAAAAAAAADDDTADTATDTATGGSDTATATADAATGGATAATTRADPDKDTEPAAPAITEEKTTTAEKPAPDPPAAKKSAAYESETKRRSSKTESKPAFKAAPENVPADVKTELKPEPPKSKSKAKVKVSEPPPPPPAAPAEKAAGQGPPPPVDREAPTADGAGGGGDTPVVLSTPAPAVVKQEPAGEQETQPASPPPPPPAAPSPVKEPPPAVPEDPPPPPPKPAIKEEREESDAESAAAAAAGPARRARTASARSEPASHESVPNSPASSAVLSGDDEEKRDYKLWKKSILLLWREFAAHRHASMFARPITNEQASNYRDIVRSPMDLAQLKRNVETGVVTSTEQFQRDLMLMFCNAMMFNSTDHEVYRFALEMQVECVEKLQLLMRDDQQGGATSTRRETRESSREELKRKRSGDDRPTPTRKRR